MSVSKKVLHVAKTANGGRFIGFQLPHLTKAGWEVHLAVPGPGVLAEMAKAAGAEVHMDSGLGGSLPSAARHLSGLLTSVQPDLVHAHFVHSTLVARGARIQSRVKPPILFQVPGPLHLEKTLPRLADIRTAGAQDHWGAACQWTFQKYLESGVPANRVHVLYYGKDLGDYPIGEVERDNSESRADLRRQLGLPVDKRLIMMVAHVYPPRRGRTRGIKGHEYFLEALAQVQRRSPDAIGVIVGGPRPGADEYFNALQQKAASLRAEVLFLGSRSDVTDLYRVADLAVHPSLSENLGGAGESLLLGVPTVSTSVGGFPDIVRPDVTGLMVPPRDSRQLAEAIQRALDMPEQMRAMALEGQKWVLRVADAATNAGKVMNVYEEMTT